MRRRAVRALLSFGLGACLLVALVLVGGQSGTVVAAGTLPPTLTFEGSAGGGTISLTTTADRSTVVEATVVGVFFPVCGGPAGGSAYMGPPAPITGGDFEFSFSFRIPIHGFSFGGSFAGENTIQGTTTFGFIIPGLSCTSDPVSWTLTGTTETSPGPDDQSFIGPAGGGPGNITIVTDPSGTSITALVLESIPMAACTKEINAIVPLTSAVPVDPADSSFQIGFSLGQMQGITVSGTLEGNTAAGTVSLFDASVICSDSVEWAATLKSAPPTVGGIALQRDLAALTLEEAETSGGVPRTITAIASSVALVTLARAAWYTRRRLDR